MGIGSRILVWSLSSQTTWYCCEWIAMKKKTIHLWLNTFHGNYDEMIFSNIVNASWSISNEINKYIWMMVMCILKSTVCVSVLFVEPTNKTNEFNGFIDIGFGRWWQQAMQYKNTRISSSKMKQKTFYVTHNWINKHVLGYNANMTLFVYIYSYVFQAIEQSYRSELWHLSDWDLNKQTGINSKQTT